MSTVRKQFEDLYLYLILNKDIREYIECSTIERHMNRVFFHIMDIWNNFKGESDEGTVRFEELLLKYESLKNDVHYFKVLLSQYQSLKCDIYLTRFYLLYSCKILDQSIDADRCICYQYFNGEECYHIDS